MQEPEACENYPQGTIIVSNLLTLSIYGVGAFPVYQSGAIWLCLYLLFIAVLELRLLGKHCVDCWSTAGAVRLEMGGLRP